MRKLPAASMLPGDSTQTTANRVIAQLAPPSRGAAMFAGTRASAAVNNFFGSRRRRKRRAKKKGIVFVSRAKKRARRNAATHSRRVRAPRARLVKGSLAARRYMAALRAKRKRR